MKTGTALLPLHYGQAPKWLFERMCKLAGEITYILVREYGTTEFLKRFSDPFWFQAFGCVLGFDWHSSGLTTTVCSALKESVKSNCKELGIFVCGGKGATSRKTPLEIETICAKGWANINSDNLVYSSKMSAKVDSTALQDGYQLYHHTFIFDRTGNWIVIQQGMNINTKWARRYHWSGIELNDFVNEPHKAICCEHKSKVLNMVAQESNDSREISTFLSSQHPDKTLADFKKIKELNLPQRHQIFLTDIKEEYFKKILLKTYENQPKNFESLLAIEGVGPKTIRAMALISELIYGKSPSFNDPVRFSFAHGGKDGHPYPINRVHYDTSIKILREGIEKAKIGNSEKLEAFKRLSNVL